MPGTSSPAYGRRDGSTALSPHTTWNSLIVTLHARKSNVLQPGTCMQRALQGSQAALEKEVMALQHGKPNIAETDVQEVLVQVKKSKLLLVYYYSCCATCYGMGNSR
jgi:hypothetical protein